MELTLILLNQTPRLRSLEMSGHVNGSCNQEGDVRNRDRTNSKDAGDWRQHVLTGPLDFCPADFFPKEGKFEALLPSKLAKKKKKSHTFSL